MCANLSRCIIMVMNTLGWKKENIYISVSKINVIRLLYTLMDIYKTWEREREWARGKSERKMWVIQKKGDWEAKAHTHSGRLLFHIWLFIHVTEMRSFDFASFFFVEFHYNFFSLVFVLLVLEVLWYVKCWGSKK